jgi:hypothetical protein
MSPSLCPEVIRCLVCCVARRSTCFFFPGPRSLDYHDLPLATVVCCCRCRQTTLHMYHVTKHRLALSQVIAPFPSLASAASRRAPPARTSSQRSVKHMRVRGRPAKGCNPFSLGVTRATDALSRVCFRRSIALSGFFATFMSPRPGKLSMRWKPVLKCGFPRSLEWNLRHFLSDL